MQKNHFSDVINLSLGSTVFLRIAKLLSNRRSKIHTIIEQLATLSAPRQRRKRFLYSSWTDNLYGGSQAIVWDWNYWLNNYFFLRNLLKKRPLIHRNGVYLDRLPTLANNLNIEELSKKNRIIFVGRNVAWKSPELILSILQTYQKQDLRALFILPSFDRNLVDNLKREFESRIDFEFGKGIEDIVFREGDIHVYPANYGPDAKFTESVSINCLEMACLGIPSLVTENGTQTWPELVEMGLLIEVDWNNFESINISIQKAVDFSATESIISSAREIISVKRNIINLLNL
jgi:glycosyltransferase involved in cell wall biosynthesis